MVTIMGLLHDARRHHMYGMGSLTQWPGRSLPILCSNSHKEPFTLTNFCKPGIMRAWPWSINTWLTHCRLARTFMLCPSPPHHFRFIFIEIWKDCCALEHFSKQSRASCPSAPLRKWVRQPQRGNGDFGFGMTGSSCRTQRQRSACPQLSNFGPEPDRYLDSSFPRLQNTFRESDFWDRSPA